MLLLLLLFPPGDIDGDLSGGSHTQQFNFSVSPLLSPSLDHGYELQQLHCAILRYLTPLRKAYHAYSLLDHTPQGGQAHQTLLTRMQVGHTCTVYSVHCIIHVLV